MWLIDMVAKLLMQKAGPDPNYLLTIQLIRLFLHQ
jgi:hypothetical protein